MYTIIKKCRICSSTHLVNILNLGSQTLANNFLKIKKKQTKIPLKLIICAKCKVVQISADVDPKVLFSNYFWITSTSKIAKDFSHKFVKAVASRIKKKPSYILEVASNDGLFLKRFKKKNCKVLGVEPAKNLAKLSNKNNIKTVNKFFDYSTSNYIKKNLVNLT